ncbi:MAG: 30S ribosomal protein S3 [Candidatus Pacebacteria bacterium]|nr:30S ribosomal protein S3 [Candidatus Paceibacterota bacterium]
MTHKVHPKGFRVGVTENWKSVGFSTKKYQKWIREDIKIRDFFKKNFEKGIIQDVYIERSGNEIKVTIFSSRPGFLIGREGGGVEKISKKIASLVKSKKVKINIEELKTPEQNATFIAQQIARDLENRIPYRKTAKKALDKIFSQKGVEGAKIILKGRLDGAEIARKETFKRGKLPSQTIRSDIDYAQESAFCYYGIVGIKVWIYKGKKELKN